MKRCMKIMFSIIAIAGAVGPHLLTIQAAEFRHHEAYEHGDAHERHSEFKAEYHFVCKEPEKLVYADVLLFSIFSGIEHIEVQLLTGTRQTAFELTPTKKKILIKN